MTWRRAPSTAHRSAAEGVRAAEALCGRTVGAPPALPFIAHSDPEIASVGRTPAQARAAGPRVRLATFPLRALGWAVAAGDTHGSAMLVWDADSGRRLRRASGRAVRDGADRRRRPGDRGRRNRGAAAFGGSRPPDVQRAAARGRAPRYGRAAAHVANDAADILIWEYDTGR